MEIDSQGQSIILKTSNQQEDRKIEIDISDFDRTSIFLAMRFAYRGGYDEIILRFKNSSTIHFRTEEKLGVLEIIHNEVNRMLGIEIIHEDDYSCIIKDYSRSTEADFETFYKKIFVLLLEMLKSSIDSIDKADLINLRNISGRYDTLSKYVSYCLRIINKKKYKEEKDMVNYSILLNIDYLIYLYKNNILEYADIYDKKFKNTVNSILEKIYECINDFQILVFSFNKDILLDFTKKRMEIEFGIKHLSSSLNMQHLIFLTKMSLIPSYLSKINPIKRI